MKRAGYTLIEVMTAVVVLTIGATGIVAMQGASVRANQDASESSIAVNVGANWLERIKRDARRWIAVGNTDATTNTSYLSAIATPGVWLVPTTVAPEQPAADYQGFDTAGDFNTDPAAAPLAYFCVNLAMTVVHAWNPTTLTMLPNADANAIRADVRVWWYRSSNDVNRALIATCRGAALTPEQASLPQIRKTYLSTVVSWREPGWP